MCVKSLVDKSPFEAITDKCPHLKNLCIVLEHVFMHRIQGLNMIADNGKFLDVAIATINRNDHSINKTHPILIMINPRVIRNCDDVVVLRVTSRNSHIMSFFVLSCMLCNLVLWGQLKIPSIQAGCRN